MNHAERVVDPGSTDEQVEFATLDDAMLDNVAGGGFFKKLLKKAKKRTKIRIGRKGIRIRIKF